PARPSRRAVPIRRTSRVRHPAMRRAAVADVASCTLRPPFQHECRERRKGERDGPELTMCGQRRRFDSAEVAGAAAAVLGSVAVEDLLPVAAGRYTEPVVRAHDWC